LKDVWKAAQEIQRVQRQRLSLRNMARLKPLLETLGKYAQAVDVLCNGTPFLPWIWVRDCCHFPVLNRCINNYIGSYQIDAPGRHIF
jgi:hypothetical protein